MPAFVLNRSPRWQVALHTQTYPLEAVNDAMDDLKQGRPHGRGILIPAGTT